MVRYKTYKARNFDGWRIYLLCALVGFLMCLGLLTRHEDPAGFFKLIIYFFLVAIPVLWVPFCLICKVPITFKERKFYSNLDKLLPGTPGLEIVYKMELIRKNRKFINQFCYLECEKAYENFINLVVKEKILDSTAMEFKATLTELCLLIHKRSEEKKEDTLDLSILKLTIKEESNADLLFRNEP